MIGLNPRGGVRVAAVGDLHCTAASRGRFRGLFEQMIGSADVLALCGDLTHAGRPEEARVLADELAFDGRPPVLAVFGNHDVEFGREDEVRRILLDAGLRVLDGESCEINGLGFAGIKGFGGGFHGRVLVRWGELVIKQFVQEALNEARKLDAALGQLRTVQKIALLHYAPIRATVVNESPEIFAFCGSSHLEPPLNRHKVATVFHGHAHHGTAEGHTSAGVPVYNVAEPLMRHLTPGRAFRVVEFAPETMGVAAADVAGAQAHAAPAH